MLPLLLDGKKMGSCQKQLDQILEVVGLSGHRKHTPRQLSGASSSVWQLPAPLIGKPEILFADEPTGNFRQQNRG